MEATDTGETTTGNTTTPVMSEDDVEVHERLAEAHEAGIKAELEELRSLKNEFTCNGYTVNCKSVHRIDEKIEDLERELEALHLAY